MLGSPCRSCLATLIVIAFSVQALAQTTWYVDASATPPGNGTPATPYASIQYAIDQPTTLSGDTLLVAPGQYVETIDTLLKGLTIRSSAGPEGTELINPGAFGFMVILRNHSSPAGNLEGFTIRTHDSGVMVVGSATLRRCILIASQTNFGERGVWVEDASSVRVENCTIAGFFDGVAVNPYTCAGTVIESSLFHSNTTDLGWSGCNGGFAKFCGFQKAPPPPAVSGWTSTNSVVHPDLGVWGPSTQDFHLEPLSVCIDKGDPSAPPDPDGSTADIGAIPYDPLYAATPTNYCAGKVHSGGCAPRLSWSGTPSLSGPDDFVLRANLALNGMPGKFIWGLAPLATPFAGGNLCIAPPLVRGPVLSSGGSGVATNCTGAYVWQVSHAYMQAQPWTPGQILYTQAWGRDPGSAFPEKSQLSDAVVFQVLP